MKLEDFNKKYGKKLNKISAVLLGTSSAVFIFLFIITVTK